MPILFINFLTKELITVIFKVYLNVNDGVKNSFLKYLVRYVDKKYVR